MIAELIPSENNRNVWIVMVDGEVIRHVHVSIFGRRLKLAQQSLPELHTALADLEYRGAKRYVLRQLSMRSLCSHELEQALKDRMVSEATVGKVLNEFRSMGYLDDQRWLENFVHSCQNQKKSSRAIMDKLRRKGFSEAEAHKAVAVAIAAQPEVERQNLQRIIDTRYGRRDLSQHKERQKVIAALLRKGYRFSDILEVLKY